MASKRIMKKRAISKAAAQAQSLNAEELLAEVNRLQEKNRQLVLQLQKVKQQDVQNQKTINKLRGQIQVIGAQLKAVKQTNVKLNIKVRQAQGEVRRLRRNSRFGFGKQIKVHRTRGEYLTEVKPTFIARFAARITAEFGIRNADEQRKLDEICAVLESKDWQALDDLLKSSEPLRETYYESQVYSTGKDTSLDYIYQLIVGQPEDIGEIAEYIPEEVEYATKNK